MAVDLAALVADAVKKAREAQAQAAQQQAVRTAQPARPAPPQAAAPAAAPAQPAPSLGEIARAQAQAASEAAAAREEAELRALSSPQPAPAGIPGVAAGAVPSVGAMQLLRAFGGGNALLSGIVLSEALAPPIALREPGTGNHA